MSLSREPTITVWNRPFRWLYLRDRETGAVWCPAWAPLGSDLDSYDCRHGATDTSISSSKLGIGSAWRATVAEKAMSELWSWSLDNTNDRPRKLDAFVILGLDNKNFMGWRSGWDAENDVFVKYAFPHHAEYDDYERLKQRPCFTVIAPSITPTSWAGRLGDVTGGACAGGMVPDAVAAGMLSNQVVHNGDPIAALHWQVDLDAGASWRVDWLAGLFKAPAEAAALRQQLIVDNEIKSRETANAEEELQLVLNSPDTALNNAVNRWWKKQITWQTRLWRNGISYPLRNILQDALGYCMYAPQEALQPMRTVTATQKSNGYLKVWTTRPARAPTTHWCIKSTTMAAFGWSSPSLVLGMPPVIPHFG